ncbi:hypothetical protein GCM10010319_23220 [Streptomyces blastmyceticus]|uniref:Uncharacterized protein n=1 Tax=Streptomyces blastmyceticus TaxID=68180 RepID=A0ABP3GLI8_9ACTN
MTMKVPAALLAATALVACAGPAAVAQDSEAYQRPLVSVDCLGQGAVLDLFETRRYDSTTYVCRDRGAVLLNASRALQGADLTFGGKDNKAAQFFR